MTRRILILISVVLLALPAIARENPSKVEEDIRDGEKTPEVRLTDPMNRDTNRAGPDRTGTSTDTIGLGPPAVRTAPARPDPEKEADEAEPEAKTDQVEVKRAKKPETGTAR